MQSDSKASSDRRSCSDANEAAAAEPRAPPAVAPSVASLSRAAVCSPAHSRWRRLRASRLRAASGCEESSRARLPANVESIQGRESRLEFCTTTRVVSRDECLERERDLQTIERAHTRRVRAVTRGRPQKTRGSFPKYHEGASAETRDLRYVTQTKNANRFCHWGPRRALRQPRRHAARLEFRGRRRRTWPRGVRHSLSSKELVFFSHQAHTPLSHRERRSLAHAPASYSRVLRSFPGGGGAKPQNRASRVLLARAEKERKTNLVLPGSPSRARTPPTTQERGCLCRQVADLAR